MILSAIQIATKKKNNHHGGALGSFPARRARRVRLHPKRVPRRKSAPLVL
jgi:hypothetical protein